MRLPHDIIYLILRDLMELLPPREIFEARLVNTVFDREIIRLMLKTTCIDQGFKSRQRPHPLIQWNLSPRRLIVLHLHRKLKQNKHTPTRFLEFMQEIFELDEVKNVTLQEREILTDQLFQAISPGGLFAPYMFSAAEAQKLLEPEAPPEVLCAAKGAFTVMEVCGAIEREDAVELDHLFQQQEQQEEQQEQQLLSFGIGCPHFRLSPIYLAATRANTEIIRVLIKHNCPLGFHDGVRMLEVLPMLMERAATRECLELWLDHTARMSREDKWHRGFGYDVIGEISTAIKRGKVDTAEFLRERVDGSREGLEHSTLMVAIEDNRMPVVDWLLERGGFGDIKTWRHEWVAIKRVVRMPKSLIVRALRSKGACLKKSDHVRQTALKGRYGKAVKCLAKSINSPIAGSDPEKYRSIGPILFSATDFDASPLVGLLLDEATYLDFSYPLFGSRGMNCRSHLKKRLIQIILRKLGFRGLEPQDAMMENKYMMLEIK